MSIPLDRLYQYIEHVASNVYSGDVVIYHFYPHGSKNVSDLTKLNPSYTIPTLFAGVEIICNDQEPLSFDYYNSTRITIDSRFKHLVNESDLPTTNLRPTMLNLHDQCVLLHSEKNSEDLLKYEANGYVPAYYFAHGFIALDWFRYARHLRTSAAPLNRKILIYNRAWANTREYRLKFADLLINNNLTNNCAMAFNPIDPESGIHYRNYTYKNAVWEPTNTLETVFPTTTSGSAASADFDLSDYTTSDIEIVLETLFDDQRIQVTEKVLRPIAIGKPFLVCSAAGTLQYLRNYGFKTFAPIIDESYDTIIDPQTRMVAIITAVRQLLSQDKDVYAHSMQELHRIAEFNKAHFFSAEFQNLIQSELATNLQHAINQVTDTNTVSRYLAGRRMYKSAKLLAYKKACRQSFNDADKLCGASMLKTAYSVRKAYKKQLKAKLQPNS